MNTRRVRFRWHRLAIYISAQAGDDGSVARIIQFYVPASFRKKVLTPEERRGKLIAFVKKSA
ncbi:MAG TPA: hypothetical protein VKR57_02310 [Terriglobales bacterium]|jgi:hypothetical protein|nr:hypothetical protein [Terriglobales bacterium]